MITVITAWYNEADLAWLFLDHYIFADKIILLLDENNSDNTQDIVKNYSNVEIKKLAMPYGMDDPLKQVQINNEYKSIKSGWVIIADADEFIYDFDWRNNNSRDAFLVDYFQMYQHKTEDPIDTITPVFEQRKHGKRNGLSRWFKPAIAKAGMSFEWLPGHHAIKNIGSFMMPTGARGAHWAMADVNLAIKRRIKGRRDRMSKNNLHGGYSFHNFEVTEEEIINACKDNDDLPRVF